MVRNIIVSSCLAISLCASANAQQFEWFDVSAFDPDLVQTNAGQIFGNVTNNIDMLATGTIRGEIKVRETDVVSVNDFMESTCFTFEFDTPLNVFVLVESLDDEEILKVGSYGDLSYTHSEGAEPEQVIETGVPQSSANLPSQTGPNPNVLVMTGNGNGFGADGAARGYINLGVSQIFSWCYTSQADQKSEALSIGILSVPEPTSLALFGICGVALGLVRRRSK
jgi:hypothetical protein